jgi:hypothetical protein
MKEGLSSEHGSELLRYSFEELLDGSAVSNEGHGHLESLWRNVTDAALDVVGNPLNKVRGVLVLYIEHLFINFFGAHSSSEHCRSSEISSMSWVRSSHHVLCIEHLLGELWNSECSVSLRSTGGKRSKSHQEEVKSGEWDKIHSELSEIRVQLSRESKAACNSAHHNGYQVVEISIGGGSQFQGSKADIIKSLIVDAHHFICIFYKLMNREGSIVGFNHGI